MGKTRDSANLVSDNNITVDVTNDRIGIGTTNPTVKLHVIGDVLTTGIITASSFSGNGALLTGVGIGTTGSINTSGIITASSFSGNGSQLTGIGGELDITSSLFI